MRIVDDDLSGPEIAALLALHLRGMHEHSPPASIHALDLDRLRTPGISFWTVWDAGALVCCGALRALGDGTGEIKSMRTAPGHLRRGGAALLLRHMLDVARARGYSRLSLETGSAAAFAPALALYRRFGFVDGAPFGDYCPDRFSRFLHLDL